MHRLRKVANASGAWRQKLLQMVGRIAAQDPELTDLAGATSFIGELVDLKASMKLRARLPYEKADIWFSLESPMEVYQVSRFRKRERETQDWIESFERGDVFYDVGANIGLFTLLAACQPNLDIRVVSFEPTFASLHSLCQTLGLNGVSQRVTPLLCGLSNETKIESLNLRRLEAGTAKSVVGEPLDHRNIGFLPAAIYNVPVFSMDKAIEVFNLPMPNHIKVDVDGIEMKVLAGAKATLADPRVRSLMVEAASVEMERELLEMLEPLGFKLFRQADKRLGALEEGHTRNNFFRR